MQVKKLDMEQQTGSKSGKYQIKAVYCDNMVTILSQYMVTIYRVTNVQSTFHMMYSDHMQSYIMWNARLDEAQAGIKIAGRNINNLRYADDNHPYGKKQRTKETLDESERGEWKSWLKTQHSEN